MFLYTKRQEDNFKVYDLKTKWRYIVLNSMVIGFILFVLGIKLGSLNPYLAPTLVIIGLILLFPSLIIVVIEMSIITLARMDPGIQSNQSPTRPKTEIWVKK